MHQLYQYHYQQYSTVFTSITCPLFFFWTDAWLSYAITQQALFVSRCQVLFPLLTRFCILHGRDMEFSTPLLSPILLSLLSSPVCVKLCFSFIYLSKVLDFGCWLFIQWIEFYVWDRFDNIAIRSRHFNSSRNRFTDGSGAAPWNLPIEALSKKAYTVGTAVT